jgi:cbb3-type cytochrome oxidase maturation protein
VTITYVVFAASALFFGGSAVMALAWALRKGQLEDFQRGATTIFDADEPIGRMTDAFPGRAAPRGPEAGESHE